MSLKNFVVKNGLTVGLANIDATSGNLFTKNANLGNLAIANFFSGAGNNLSNIQGANVSGQVGNALVSGTVYTNAQPNITSVGTLTGLTVNGVSNLGANGNVIITGGSSGQFLQTNGSGNLSWVTVGTSGISNGTSSVSVPVSNGNILANVNGSTILTVASSGANITGYANVTGNANVGNLGTGGLITATGNITAGNVTTAGKVVASALESNVATGTAPIVVASTTKVTNLNADLLDGYDTATAATANTVVVRDANGNITGNNISGTLSTASQPNITSVGTLSSLEVTGNITTSANVVTDLIVGKTSGVTIAATGSNQDIELKPSGTGTVDVWSKVISNVALPVASTDAATKGYVDAAVEGLHIHAPCAAATPNTLATISSGTVTYNNGTSGVGATLTTTGTYTTIDGVNIASVGTRVLVKNEANAAHNGIYTYTSSTVLTRATDFDTPTEMGGGDFTFIQQGTLYNDTGWVMTDPVTTVGTTNVNWVQFSGAGTYTAGTGLTLNGTEFSISNTAVTAGAYGNGDYVATFTVNAQGQLTAAANTAITANAANLSGTTLNSGIVNSSLTSVGTLGSLAVTGNATAGNVYANSGTVGASLLTGTLTTAAQPNVTSVGTLTSLTVTGNASAGNISTGGALSVTGTASITGNANVGNLGTAQVLATANITTPQLIANIADGTAPLIVNSTTKVANLNADLLDGFTTATANTANTIALRNADGNLSANYFIGNGAFLTGIDTSLIANGNSNVTVAANGNVTVSVAGNSAIAVFTGTGANINGYANITGNANVGNLGATGVVATTLGGSLTTAAQPNVTSVGTLTSLAVTGTITGGNIYANAGTVGASLLTGTLTTNAQPNVTSVGTLTSLAVTGNVTAGNVTGSNLMSANYLTGTLTTAAQPNITSVGTLTSLTTSGNIVTSGNLKIGATGVGITSNRANVSVTSSATVIDQFAPSNWRTAKYVISASGADGYQSVEALVVHDGTDAYITIYGSVCSNTSADIIDVSANINGISGNVAVYAVSNSASCVVNLVSSYIKT
jgi:hypothetical protein